MSPPEQHNLRHEAMRILTTFAEARQELVLLSSDSLEAAGAVSFAEAFPDRCYSFGIAEQDMVSAAAGMALAGCLPVVVSYSQFITMRALDQLRNSVAYQGHHVLFCCRIVDSMQDRTV